MNPTTTDSLRELDHRSGDGIDVSLLWNPVTNCVSIQVVDTRSGEVLAFPVAADDAVNAFHHPYAFGHAGRDSSKIAILPWD
jgi:hypothetical protein